MFRNLSGFSKYTKLKFMRRFEYNFYLKNKNYIDFKLGNLSLLRKKTINSFISRITNTNKSIFELIKINLIRLYLIKSFRGRAQALGKPSRGQRTWSNAWTAYKYNTTLKLFIRNLSRLQKSKLKKKKINYKLIEKKIRKPVFKIKQLKPVIKKNLWF
uniref:Ribosomal protein S13 n=1 Tax=Pseudourostyla cristata TaxID=293816 RepID=A0A4P9JLN4_9SPIT|nr:ribosomal protein S13 [Pseudourostyla cristata]